MTDDRHDVTELLLAWRAGDQNALNQLTTLVHQELHRIARRCMAGERMPQTLQTTALVNEAFLRLVDVRLVNWQNRAHFLAMAARVMRRVLVDAARARRAEKRGGDIVHVTLEEPLVAAGDRAAELLPLDDALEALAVFDPRKSRIVELRFFGGLSLEETAEVLGVSVKTVMRDWNFAKAWLQREILGPRTK